VARFHKQNRPNGAVIALEDAQLTLENTYLSLEAVYLELVHLLHPWLL
jgi:hypothetical protein